MKKTLVLAVMLSASAINVMSQLTGDFSDADGWLPQIYYGTIRMADVNGDGIDDLCGRAAAGIVCALNNGDGTFQPLQLWTTDFSDANGWDQLQHATTIQFGDINGDGKADVCGRGRCGRLLCSL
jgi:FG-GAP-like repeat